MSRRMAPRQREKEPRVAARRFWPPLTAQVSIEALHRDEPFTCFDLPPPDWSGQIESSPVPTKEENSDAPDGVTEEQILEVRKEKE